MDPVKPVNERAECSRLMIPRLWSAFVHLFPNLPSALLVLILVPVESLLLLANASHIYRADPMMIALVPVTLFWVWFSVVWVLWLIIGPASERIKAWRSGRAAGVGFIALGAIVAVVVYVVSWMLYIQSGEFLELQGVLFILNNPRMLKSYMVDAQPTDLAKGLFGMAVMLTAAPFFLRWLVRSRWEVTNAARVSSRRRMTWCISALVVASGVLYATQDMSDMRMVQRLQGLTRRLNPVVALATSTIGAAFDERIEADLDNNELQRIGPHDWQPRTLTDPPSIIFIAVESMRPDMIHQEHQGQLVMPKLSELAKNSLRLTRVYSESTHSDYADPCIWSSLYPLRTRRHHYYRASDPWPKQRIYDVLRPAGYSTAYISSQNECWGNMDQFLRSPNLDVFYHSLDARDPSWLVPTSGKHRELPASALLAGKLEDRHTTDVALAWVTEQVKQGKPFFLGMAYQSSHFPYLLPADVEQPFQPSELDSSISFFGYPLEKTPVVRNAYFNALHESDRNIGRLVQTLRDLGRLDNTILVITGDQGEFLQEHGHVTHACEPFEPGLRVGCVIHAPGRVKPGVEAYPVELVDLIPTTLGLMGWPSHPNFQGIDVLAANRPPLEERLIFGHVENLSLRWDVVQLAGRWKFMHDREKSTEMLFDLETDPGETINLLAAKPELAQQLREVLKTWRRQQLAYYHYPAYYREYYPPRPPRLALKSP